MRNIKIALLVVLVITVVIFGATEVYGRILGADVPPSMECASEALEVSVNDDPSVYLTGVTARDQQDGDLTDQILISGISKLINEDTVKVTYLVFDSDDNLATCVRQVRFTDYTSPRFVVEEPLVFSSTDTSALGTMISVADAVDEDLDSGIRLSQLRSTAYGNIYSVVAQVTNSLGDYARVELPVVIQSSTYSRPQISLSEQLIYLEQGDSFDPQDYLVSVRLDSERLSLTNVRITSEVDTSEPGCYWVYYSCAEGAVEGVAVLAVVVQ